MLVTASLLVYATPHRSKDETRELLYGIWVHQQDSDNTSLRFVRAKSWEKDKMGLNFKSGNELLMQMPLGCQMPLPNMHLFTADWSVKAQNRVEIDQHFPGEKPKTLSIEKLNKRVLRFNW